MVHDMRVTNTTAHHFIIIFCVSFLFKNVRLTGHFSCTFYLTGQEKFYLSYYITGGPRRRKVCFIKLHMLTMNVMTRLRMRMRKRNLAKTYMVTFLILQSFFLFCLWEVVWRLVRECKTCILTWDKFSCEGVPFKVVDAESADSSLAVI